MRPDNVITLTAVAVSFGLYVPQTAAQKTRRTGSEAESTHRANFDWHNVEKPVTKSGDGSGVGLVTAARTEPNLRLLGGWRHGHASVQVICDGRYSDYTSVKEPAIEPPTMILVGEASLGRSCGNGQVGGDAEFSNESTVRTSSLGALMTVEAAGGASSGGALSASVAPYSTATIDVAFDVTSACGFEVVTVVRASGSPWSGSGGAAVLTTRDDGHTKYVFNHCADISPNPMFCPDSPPQDYSEFGILVPGRYVLQVGATAIPGSASDAIPSTFASASVEATLKLCCALDLEIVDLNDTRFRVGPNITASPRKLATGGRPVGGLVADGVTQILLRMTTPGPGTVEFVVKDESGATVESTVGILDNALTSATANPLTVHIVQVGHCSNHAFARLTAPQDFARPGNDIDWARRNRILLVDATYTPDDAEAEPTILQTTLELHRPPVLLLHGLWSSADAWKFPLVDDPRFIVHAHDYKPANSSPIELNVVLARLGVQQALVKARSLGIAATRVDAVGSSMGGLLLREYVAGQRAMFLRDENLGKGDIQKLITLDTPHFGSPLACLLVGLDNQPTSLV